MAAGWEWENQGGGGGGSVSANPNEVVAGPATGSDPATVAPRPLVPADIPSHSAAKLTSGAFGAPIGLYRANGDPSVGYVDGQFYYNDTTKKMRVREDGVWVEPSRGGHIFFLQSTGGFGTTRVFIGQSMELSYTASALDALVLLLPCNLRRAAFRASANLGTGQTCTWKLWDRVANAALTTLFTMTEGEGTAVKIWDGNISLTGTEELLLAGELNTGTWSAFYRLGVCAQ